MFCPLGTSQSCQLLRTTPDLTDRHIGWIAGSDFESLRLTLEGGNRYIPTAPWFEAEIQQWTQPPEDRRIRR